jgi:hypothetical protein
LRVESILSSKDMQIRGVAVRTPFYDKMQLPAPSSTPLNRVIEKGVDK